MDDLQAPTEAPSPLPPLPAPVERLIAPKLPPGDWTTVSDYARSAGLALLLSEPGVWAVGTTHDGAGGPAVGYLVDSTLGPLAASRVPKTVTLAGRTFPVVVSDVPRRARMHGSTAAASKYAGALTGCLISVDRDQLELANVASPTCGTLSGVFPPLGGSGRRAVTNAHVALGLDATDLFGDPLNSFPKLFRSPGGRRVLAYENGDDSFGAYQLFQVDTYYPILMPIPFALFSSILSTYSFTLSGGPLTGAIFNTLIAMLSAGPLAPLVSTLTSLLGFGGVGLPDIFGTAPLTFQYIDVASGPIDPKVVPGSDLTTLPPPPPVRRTVRGRDLSAGHLSYPGTAVYAIGTARDLRWGSLAMMGTTVRLDLTLPFGLLGGVQSVLGASWSPPPALVLNVDLYAMEIAPGDSGMMAIARVDDAPLGICGIGLGGTGVTPHNSLTMGTPLDVVQVFGEALV